MTSNRRFRVAVMPGDGIGPEVTGAALAVLGAALVGGMGMAPSADIGDEHALFQPAHGSAPDIAGQGIANPIATIQSAAMMLDWLAERHDLSACAEAGRRIDAAVATVLAEGRARPVDLGGADGTEAVTRAIAEALGAAPNPVMSLNG